MRQATQGCLLLAWFWATASVLAAPVPYSPDADTIGLYHVDAAGIWTDASTNQRHLAAAPGGALVSTVDLGVAFTNGYRGGTGDVGAVQYTNANWTLGNTLTVEAWIKAGISSNALSPKLFTLNDKINGVILEFVLRDMNVVSGGNVLMTPAIRYSEPSSNALWITDGALYAHAMATGQWYHVAFALNLTNGRYGKVDVYITPKGASSPWLFDTIALSTNLYKGTGTKSWVLDRSTGGNFVFDEFRISSRARAAIEFETTDIRASWVAWGLSAGSLVGLATNVVPGSKVYRTLSLAPPSWQEAVNGVWTGPVGGLYQFQYPATNPPAFFSVGH